MTKHTRLKVPEGTTHLRNASTGEVKDLRLVKLAQFVDNAMFLDDSSHNIAEMCLVVTDQWSKESHDTLTNQVAELRAALDKVLEISGGSNEQNMANFDDELASQHNDDINEIYHIVKALKDGGL